jgi:hypothetical protein
MAVSATKRPAWSTPEARLPLHLRTTEYVPFTRFECAFRPHPRPEPTLSGRMHGSAD